MIIHNSRFELRLNRLKDKQTDIDINFYNILKHVFDISPIFVNLHQRKRGEKCYSLNYTEKP